MYSYKHVINRKLKTFVTVLKVNVNADRLALNNNIKCSIIFVHLSKEILFEICINKILHFYEFFANLHLFKHINFQFYGTYIHTPKQTQTKAHTVTMHVRTHTHTR